MTSEEHRAVAAELRRASTGAESLLVRLATTGDLTMWTGPAAQQYRGELAAWGTSIITATAEARTAAYLHELAASGLEAAAAGVAGGGG